MGCVKWSYRVILDFLVNPPVSQQVFNSFVNISCDISKHLIDAFVATYSATLVDNGSWLWWGVTHGITTIQDHMAVC